MFCTILVVSISIQSAHLNPVWKYYQWCSDSIYTYSHIYQVISMLIIWQFSLRRGLWARSWPMKMCSPVPCWTCGDNHSSNEIMRARATSCPENNFKLCLPTFSDSRMLSSLFSAIFPGPGVGCEMFVVILLILFLYYDCIWSDAVEAPCTLNNYKMWRSYLISPNKS